MNDRSPPGGYCPGNAASPTGPQHCIMMIAAAEVQGTTPEQMRAGTPGHLLNSTDPQVLLSAIRAMGRGNMPNDGGIAQRVMPQVTKPVPQPVATPVTQLGRSEKEVLHSLVEGPGHKMIAHRLRISFEAVGTHLMRIYEKLQAHSNTEAVAKALRSKLVA